MGSPAHLASFDRLGIRLALRECMRWADDAGSVAAASAATAAAVALSTPVCRVALRCSSQRSSSVAESNGSTSVKWFSVMLLVSAASTTTAAAVALSTPVCPLWPWGGSSRALLSVAGSTTHQYKSFSVMLLLVSLSSSPSASNIKSAVIKLDTSLAMSCRRSCAAASLRGGSRCVSPPDAESRTGGYPAWKLRRLTRWWLSSSPRCAPAPSAHSAAEFSLLDELVALVPPPLDNDHYDRGDVRQHEAGR